MKIELRMMAAICLIAFAMTAGAVRAQTTAFVYQGKLTDGAIAANGSYDFEFVLFDAPTGGAQLGLQAVEDLPVTAGIFSVELNFGAVSFPGANRYLEIRLRPGTSTGGFQTLLPRQPVTSSPYTIQALNANQLGGVAAANFLQTNGNGSGLTNLNAANLNGVVPIGSGGTGSATQNFVDLTTGQTIAGAKTFSSAVNTAVQFNIGGSRVLGTPGTNNIFAGFEAGFFSAGSENSFFGAGAGRVNGGSANSFFGMNAGLANSAGSNNSFFGRLAGVRNTSGSENSFFGESAGFNNISGFSNSFFGDGSGRDNTSGFNNSFFGARAGLSNTGGDSNSFFGGDAGLSNSTGGFNSFFGLIAGRNNLTGRSNSYFGAAAGQDTTGSENSFFGSSAGTITTTGANNAFFGYTAGNANTTGSSNTLIGGRADVSAPNLTFATALGADAIVSTNNTVVLGRNLDTVRIPGNLIVTGSVAKSSGSFKIDHPLDPENKYLSHSFVESPDMMNIYNGNTTTDSNGEAIIRLPDYFSVLNRDFRYQLTVIGTFAQAIVAEKIKDNQFKIRTDKPNVEVSWQVTGIRRDKFAEDNRVPITEDKPESERGRCLYAPLCGGKSVDTAPTPKP